MAGGGWCKRGEAAEAHYAESGVGVARRVILLPSESQEGSRRDMDTAGNGERESLEPLVGGGGGARCE